MAKRGRPRIHPKIEPRLKTKTITPPPPPPQPGPYAYHATYYDGFDQYRDLKGVTDAESREDAIKQVEAKTPGGWRMIRLVLVFMGLIGAGTAFILLT